MNPVQPSIEMFGEVTRLAAIRNRPAQFRGSAH